MTKTQNKLKIIFITFFAFVFFFFLFSFVNAATYYVSPSGSDSSSGVSTNAPWSTFSHAMTKLQPGDTLYLMDGTYYQSLTVTISGTQGSPIIFKALNEGKAVIDGAGKRIPVWVYGQSFIDIEDIIATDSNEDVVLVSSGATNVNIRRVLAHDAGTGNFVIFAASGGSSYILFEDVAAWGEARKMFLGISSSNITMRRCWGRFESWNGIGGEGPTGIQVYRTNDSVIENCIFVRSPTATHTSKGISAVRVKPSNENNRNRFFGNMVHGFIGGGYAFSLDGNENSPNLTGHKWYNNVAIKPGTIGYRQDVGDNTVGENFTLIGLNTSNILFFFKRSLSITEGFKLAGTLKNSSLLTGSTGLFVDAQSPGFVSFTNTYNNYFDLIRNYGDDALQGVGETIINPNYDITTYGDGAYLFVPPALKGKGENGSDIGAEVLYRYQDGVLTNEPLWPWPMEDRICNEIGVSVTYEDAGNGCTGGLWKTLDSVYDTSISQPPTPEPLQLSANTIVSLKTLTPITTDGNLESVWNQANSVTFSNPSKSDNTVKVSTLYDDTNLYIAYQVTDSNLEATDTKLWNDDGAEIYIDTQNNKSTSKDADDYSFMTNINDLTSNASITSKTTTNTAGYTQEITIPFSTLNITPNNQTLGLLLANNDRDNSSSSQFDWLDLINTGSYSRPNLWGDLILSSQTVGTPTILQGDLNQDNTVNTLDWSIMNSVWGTADTQSDLNNDGIVNTIDFSIMNSNWSS